MRFFNRVTRRELCRDLHNVTKDRNILSKQITRLVYERNTFEDERNKLTKERDAFLETFERREKLRQRERSNLRDALIAVAKSIITTPTPDPDAEPEALVVRVIPRYSDQL